MAHLFRGAFALLFLLAACGGRARVDEEPPRATRPVADGASPTSACGHYAEAACVRLVRCGRADDPFGGANFASLARCAERLQLACSHWRNLPGIAMDDARVASCAAFVETSDCRRPVDDLWNVFAFCPATRGALSQGSTVLSPRQCESGVAEHDRGCRACSAEGATHDLPEGACDVEHPCAAGACRGGWCAGANGTPTEDIEVSLSTERCSGVDRPRVVCAPGHACVRQNDRGNGVCMPFATEGASCAYEGPGCEWPATCQKGRCALPALTCTR